MNRLLLQPTPLSQWYELVTQAHAVAPAKLDQATESYLVYLLMRFSDQPHALHSVLAIDFLEGAHQQGARREQQLRDVGDKCLLLSGLFPGRADRRCLRLSYFVDLGQTAYESLSTRVFEVEEDMYNNLSKSFVPMMDVLHTLRAMSDKHDDQMNLTQAAQLWEETGSLYAFELLRKIK